MIWPHRLSDWAIIILLVMMAVLIWEMNRLTRQCQTQKATQADDPLFIEMRRQNDLLSRITIRADQCHGRLCIRGMRIRVADILAMLAEDVTADEILRDFPDLEYDDIRACLAYAAGMAGHPGVAATELRL